MKIWFDLSNSPHVNLFFQLIKELESEGHKIIITTRPLANTIQLLEQKGLTYSVVGDHYGKSIFRKVAGYPIRVIQLYRFLKNKKIDIAVSQSSFHSPVTAKLLGVPSIYTNDNEHALGNLPAFFSATKILIPESLSEKKILKYGISSKKLIKYPGVKEGIFLWNKGAGIQSAREHIHEQFYHHIYIRPEPQTAQYYKGKQNFLDEVITSLQNTCKITILPRDATQSAYYQQPKFKSVEVPERPLLFDEVAAKCSLFIGAGGSMTRELAVMGIPCISVYQDALLDVDVFLLNKGMLLHERTLTADLVLRHLRNLTNSKPDSELLKKGRQAYFLFKKMILDFDMQKVPTGAVSYNSLITNK